MACPIKPIPMQNHAQYAVRHAYHAMQLHEAHFGKQDIMVILNADTDMRMITMVHPQFLLLQKENNKWKVTCASVGLIWTVTSRAGSASKRRLPVADASGEATLFSTVT